MHLQTPKRVADHFVHQPPGRVPEAEGSRFRTGRSGYVEAHAGAKSVDAKQVSSIRDGEDAVQVILPGNGGQAGGGFFCIGTLRLSNDLILRNPMGEKVVMADAPFGVSGTAATTQGNHQRGEVFAVESKGMIQTGAQHRRRAAIVLRCAKDGDRVGGTRLIMSGVIVNLPVYPEKPSQNGDKTGEQ
ncbi:MAG: hypothetical protein QOJ42_1572 [Acidobacteriaceae bacterium]|nr:hypothetical protein [Acidobacteriaceae bacterium]